MTMSVHVLGAEEFKSALKQIQKEMPVEAYKKLDNEATLFEGEIKDAYPRVGVNSTKLKDSFKHKGQIFQSGGDFTVRVNSDAPNDHLIEFGHALVTHKPRKRKIGHVRAFGAVQNAMDVFNDGHTERISNWLYQMIDEGMR